MESNKKYEWLLFDLDNTILDFNIGSKKAFQKLLAQLGIEEEAHYDALYQSINKHIWWEFNKGLISQDDVRRKRFFLFFQVLGIEFDAGLANQIYFQHLGKEAEFIPGALEMLKSLKSKGYRLCMITNGMKEVQHSRIKISGLDEIFEHFIISDEIGVAKPDKAFFDEVLKRLDVDSLERSLVIGDTPQSDILGANNYGIDSCWYNPKNYPTVNNIEATFNIQELEQIENEILKD